MSDIAYGSGNDPGLPPVNLPSMGGASGPLRITVGPGSKRAEVDGAWGATLPEFKSAEPPSDDRSSVDGAFGSTLPQYDPEKNAAPSKASDRQIGTDEAALAGGVNSLTFGTAPAISGAAEASGIKAPDMQEQVDPLEALHRAGTFVSRPVVGGINMLSDALSEHHDPAVKDSYERGRKAALEDERLAQEQHPIAFLGGQLAGALAGPGLGAVGGASAMARVGRGFMAGTTAGGLYGGGSSLSEGNNASQIAKDAALGAGTGAVFGGVGGVGAEVAGATARKGMSILRGGRNPDLEAARKIAAAQQDDFARTGRTIDDGALAAANTAGTPRAIIDAGGQHTRDLARSAGNTSSDAWDRMTHFAQRRFEDQSPRISGFINHMFGGGLDAGADSIAIKAAGRIANRPNYARAYRSGDRPIWSPELERLAGSPAVQSAIKSAVTSGKDKAIKDGFGGFNPGIQVTQDGRLLMPKGKNGVPTYPNIQFWDYVQRDLKDAATSVEGKENAKAATLNGLHHDLNSELDKLVPDFKSARQGAAVFFKAHDASEAGRKFVMMNANLNDAGRALSKMTKPERELFARSFASELADRVMKVGDTTNVLDKVFIDSHEARRKIAMAMGPDRAGQLEALLRVESVVDRARTAFGNSTTARQLKQLGMSAGHGMAGAGAVAGFEGLKEHEFNPAHVIAAALTFGAARHGAHVIDEKVARRVGELLVSSDPTLLAKGLQIVQRSPIYFNALRKVTASNSRIAAHDIGPVNTAAGVGAGLGWLIHEGESAGHPHDSLMDQVP